MVKEIVFANDGLGFDEAGILITAAQFEAGAREKKARLLEEKKGLIARLAATEAIVEYLHRAKYIDRKNHTRDELRKISLTYIEAKKRYGALLRSLNAVEKVLLRYLYDEK